MKVVTVHPCRAFSSMLVRDVQINRLQRLNPQIISSIRKAPLVRINGLEAGNVMRVTIFGLLDNNDNDDRLFVDLSKDK